MAVKKSSSTSVIEGSLKPSDYVHLHNHTHHSLLDGMTKINELVSRVKELGMRSVAITDHGTLSGAIEFYKVCRSEDIKPIIGIETYVAARTIADKDPVIDKHRYHLIVLAMNNIGYQNLMNLSTIANLDGMYYKPRVDHELLEKYNEGLIVLSGCAGGEIADNLRNGNYKEAKRIAAWYKKIFGDRYYLEIQDHDEWDVQKSINDQVFKLSGELGIECVLTSDAHYLSPKDQEAHEILLCVGTGAYLSDNDRMSLKDFHLHVTDPAEIIERWGVHPEVIRNTAAIADRCEVEIEFGKYLIPKFPVPKRQTEKSYLDKLTYSGLVKRYTEKEPVSEVVDELKKQLPKDIINRAEYELGIINNMGFSGYFLIVQDFINWGKDKGIVFGPGRGSGAGSIVAYALRITELDPLTYDLLFERFLNPDRISMPDFDIDIQDTRRDEVIQYCVEKYGKERVANIVTFGTMAARAAIRDVARVLQVPYAEADRLAKLIPPPIQGRHIPLSVSIKEDPDLKREYDTNQTSKQVIDYAIRLEGTIRSHGVHAAGVVIAPDDIVKFTPLEMAQKGVIATQYSMGPITDDLGMLKMDFLGLSNLTIIKNTLRIVRKVYGKEIDITKIPLNDKKTFKLFQQGDTTGVFQLESAGMKRYLKELSPTVFEDIISMVALYRPGPMQWIGDFIDRKHGRMPIEYMHPAMKPALKSTYGVIVTQEQVMQISKEMCGFTGGQADTLRKAIGKKDPKVLAKMKSEFIEGAIKTVDADRVLMERLWKQLEDFAAYCFNKAHSACYAMIAYWTAYLKAHYPDAFMASLMTSDQDDTDRLSIEIAECRHMGIKVLPPDVNESFVEFSVVPGQNTIRFGMAAVKGVGTGAVEEILRARETGLFKSVEDFAKRINTRIVNRKAWESLIKSGAFDQFTDRSDLLYNLDMIMAYTAKIKKDVLSGQTDLFGGSADALTAPGINMEEAPSKHTKREKLLWERELLGLYLSSHPLDDFDTFLIEQTVPISSLKPEHDNMQVTVGGVVTTLRVINTKNGSKMAFMGIEDKTGESEVVVFPSLFEKISDSLSQDVVIKATGKVNARGRDGIMTDDVKVIADDIQIISHEEAESYKSTGKTKSIEPAKKVLKKSEAAKSALKEKIIYKPVQDESSDSLNKIYVHVKNPDDHDRLLKLKQTFNKFPGSDEIILVLGDNKNAVRLPFGTGISDELKSAVAALYGTECVAVK